MKKAIPTIAMVVLFVCGLSLFLYPTVSNLYNEYRNKAIIGEYEELVENVRPEEYKKAKEQAANYNQYYQNPQKLEELGLTYESMLNVAGNGVMGYIEIPKISVSLVIYHSIEENVLQRGIGHVEDSALPIGGETTHAVLAGHTGLPSAKLLTNIDHLNVGDRFYIHVLNEVLEYQIDDISVVLPHETDRLNVVPGKDYVTLVTCTPYGVNSHRLLVRGVRVGSGSATDPDHLAVHQEIEPVALSTLLTVSLVGLAILGVGGWFLWRRISRRKKKGGEEDAS
ncbi:MAG: class C sortase [Clostridia bacterium]|nr:class C sortase [Clostridia bacterium]